MSFGKIIKGYWAILSALFTFLAIAACCVIVGFMVVYPLWKFASENPYVYTFFSISTFLCVIIYFFVKRIITSYKKSPQRLLISFLKKITLIAGISLFIYFTISFKKVIAFVILFSVILLYGVLAFGLPSKITDENER